MVTILVKQTISTTPKLLLDTLLDHKKLNRFFNAKFSIIKPEIQGEVPGGKGCVREVKTAGLSFQEKILSANCNEIQYKIISKFFLKKHRGHIKIFANKQKPIALSDLEYLIVFQVPWYLPRKLIKKLVEHDLQKAMNKLKEYFDAC